ncbi:hypothetical protein LTR41_011771 [Exophiala xenobiotica]|nr:hypothetical protein LTR41_011771 [Exophiala xenobiotica]KAK5550397.1 hypothetical protein LTR46_011596 [Exophiala xenobiotica]
MFGHTATLYESTPKRKAFTSLDADSIVVGQQRITGPYSDAAEQVVLFVKCAPEVSTTTLRVRPDLEAAIREQIAQDLSRRHVPTFVFETEVVPYNANGKKLEIQVKAVLCGGEAALSKLKLTQDELMQIKWYEPFYRIEKVLEGLSREGGAKARL